jgi:hypothetical protein
MNHLEKQIDRTMMECCKVPRYEDMLHIFGNCQRAIVKRLQFLLEDCE